MDKITQDIEDIYAIFDELKRFASMEFRDYVAHMDANPQDAFCTIPHPFNSGILICGHEAFRRFHQITLRHLKTLGDVARDYNESDFGSEIIHHFSDRFLKKSFNVNKDSVQSFLSVAQKQSKKKHKELTHYIPCVIVDEKKPERFNIGIVEFIRMEVFLEENKEKILEEKRNLAESYKKRQENGTPKTNNENKDIQKEADEWANIFITELHNYFLEYKWVAKVTIPKCDIKISRCRAEIVIGAALDIIKLFFRELHGKGLRMGHDAYGPENTANLTSEVEKRNKFHISYGWREIRGTYAGDNWFQEMTNPKIYPYIDGAASALNVRISPTNKMHLKERLLDALTWYGQAVSDTLPSTKIVKYVAAWERLVITKKEQDLTSTVCKRIAMLAHDGYQKTFQVTSKDAKEIYNWRSNLMHGTSSPFTLNIENSVPIAEKLTQASIFQAIDIFICLCHRIKDPQPRDLEEEYTRIETKFFQDLEKEKRN